MKRKELSKLMSYILRHHPDKFGLELGNNGFVDLGEFTRAIQKEHPEVIWADILREVYEFKDKQRFEIKGDKIRALHGHSVESNIKHTAEKPPKVLYHGTSRRAYELIKVEGLKPMNREFIHLSENTDMAIEVANRYDKKPVIMQIDTENMSQDFFKSSNGIWLTSKIDSEYLKVVEL